MRLILLTLVAAAVSLARSATAEEPKPREGPRNVAIVIFEGVELLDFAGPGEVFAGAWLDGKPAFHTYTVAESKQPVKSMGFVEVTPQYALDDCPAPDIVVVPGGRVPDGSAKLRSWLLARAPKAELMMSVCNGALVYGAAGLLEGLEATTHKSTLQSLALLDPKITVFTNRRFVDSGRVLTTAGISAGIDGALHVVSRMCGEKMAWKVARNMEYDWRPDEIARLHAEPGRPVEGIEALQIVTKTNKVGLEATLAEYKQLEKQPSEKELNNWGYTLLRAKKIDDAVGLLRFTEAAFPTSSNASDSLSEALEAKGDIEGAKKAAQTCLARLEKEHPADPDHALVVRNAAASRIARLSGAPASTFRFVCAPCGGECDLVGYLEGTRCPGCAMQLVEKEVPAKASTEKTAKGAQH